MGFGLGIRPRMVTFGGIVSLVIIQISSIGWGYRVIKTADLSIIDWDRRLHSVRR